MGTDDIARVPAPGEPVATPASSADARREATKLSARGYSVIRQTLVQQTEAPWPAILGRIVRERKHRALLTYLMVLTIAPWLLSREKPLPAAAWIRLLDAPEVTGSLTWSGSTLSRAFADLETLNLLEPPARHSRLRVVVPRREDGTDVWSPPEGQTDDDKYFSIPDEFWLEDTFAKLHLPGLALLLILAKETSGRDEMYLPFDRAPERYGISEKTARNGIGELGELGLLHKRSEYLKQPLSAIGWSERIWYSLTGHYSQTARAERRKKARTEAAARAAASEETSASQPRAGRRQRRRVKPNNPDKEGSAIE